MASTKDFEEWLLFAQRDLDSANHLLSMHPVPLEIICYLSQQCGEKALKGFLVYHNVDFPKIHDLKKLCALCAEFDAEFNQVDCETLTIYGTAPRYPFSIEIDEPMTQKALSDAKAVLDFVKDKIQ